MRTSVFPEEVVVAKNGRALLFPPDVDATRVEIESDATIAIEIPDTKPATEFLFGRFEQKVSPQHWHGVLAFELANRLRAWDPDGSVSVEPRFTVAIPHEIPHSIVPDVVYMPREQFLAIPAGERAEPRTMPTLIAEILSPRDRRGKVAERVALVLRAGTPLVVVVYAKQRRIVAHGRAAEPHTFVPGDVLAHPVLPGFALDVADYLSVLADYPL